MTERDSAIVPFRRVSADEVLVFGHLALGGRWTCSSVDLLDSCTLVARFDLPGTAGTMAVTVTTIERVPGGALRMRRCAVHYQGHLADLTDSERASARSLVLALGESIDLRLSGMSQQPDIAVALGRESGCRRVRFDEEFVRALLATANLHGGDLVPGWTLADVRRGSRADTAGGDARSVVVDVQNQTESLRLLLLISPREEAPAAFGRSYHFALSQRGSGSGEKLAEMRILVSFLLQVHDHEGLEVEFPAQRDEDREAVRAALRDERRLSGTVERAPQACAGKVALITGASRGIGAAIATRLAREGARVALVARSLDTAPPGHPGTLREVVERIEQQGGFAVAIQGDVADATSRCQMVARSEELLGPIDILVNNAGHGPHGSLLTLTDRDFQETFDVNVRAVFHMCQLVLPGMRAKQRGWVLNISSGTGTPPAGPPFPMWQQVGGHHLYAASKAALTRLTAGLAAEFYRDGIAINALAPRLAVDTAGFRQLRVDALRSDPRFEPPEAMAEAALVLCTVDPTVMTGRFVRSLELLEDIGQPFPGLEPLPRTMRS
jgi:citronellol/citronellal dehydrogenase